MTKPQIDEYLDYGKVLTLLKGKIPILKAWQEKVLSDNEIRAHCGNFGWVMGDEDFVVDIDPRHGGDDSFKKLQKDLGLSLDPTVKTPRGGYHIYLSLPKLYQGLRFRKSMKDYPGIDFLSRGGKCLIVGCETEHGIYDWCDDDFLAGFTQNEAPVALLDKLTDGSMRKNPSKNVDEFGLLITNDQYWSKEDIEEKLSRIDPSMDNNEWVKVGMALHNWHPEKGLALWEDWSKGGDNYVDGETAKRWRSFNGGGGVTLGTLDHMVKEVDYDEAVSEVKTYVDKINTSNSKELEFNIAPAIKKLDISEINREKLVKTYQDRYKALTDTRLPIAMVRDLLKDERVLNGQIIEDLETPEWCYDWVYVNTHSSFFNLEERTIYKSESFNLICGKDVPFSDKGKKPYATKFVADHGFVRVFHALAYAPTINEVEFETNGLRYINSFNPKSVPKEAKDHSKKGLEAIDKIKRHIDFITIEPENAKILTEWLAHQVQFPGVKILWAPLIQSIQGIGKSFFAELLRACLGDRNIGVVRPKSLGEKFNAWATGRVVNVMEEIRIKGQNRHEIEDSLKTLITERVIDVEGKGVDSHNTINTTNYMAFTNYKDSLPLNNNDRRWWVLFHPIESRSDFVEWVGQDHQDYFIDLHEAVKENKAEIRKWLLDYKISEEFIRMKVAPMTASKRSMIATEEANFEGLSEVAELIERGGSYFNKDCISSSDLFEELSFEHPEINLNTRSKHNILKKLGYTVIQSRIKIDNCSKRIWAKRQMENEKIREIFNKK